LFRLPVTEVVGEALHTFDRAPLPGASLLVCGAALLRLGSFVNDSTD
jgi:hypothetical protein